MKILLTGATGYLGAALLDHLRSKDGLEIHLLSRRPIDGLATRVSQTVVSEVDLEVGRAAVEEVRPNAVVHCAAIASSSECQRAPEDAERVNVQFSRGLAQGCHSVGARMVHVSTDLVFEGAKCPPGGFTESASPSPVTEYAKSKLRGEDAVRAICSNSVIIRICLLFGGRFGGKFGPLEWMISNFRSKRSVPLFFDEWRTPVFVNEVAAALISMAKRSETGIFHLGGPRRLNRVELGELVAQSGGFSTELIQQKSRQEASEIVFRPEDVSFNSEKLCSETLKISLSSPEEALSHVNFS